MFDPGPSEWGPPPVHVGALGPKLTEMVAAEADGLLLMPFTSRRFFEDRTLAAIHAGLERRSSELDPLEVVPELILCVGRDDDELAAADAGCRALLGFYGSTPLTCRCSKRRAEETCNRPCATLHARAAGTTWQD